MRDENLSFVILAKARIQTCLHPHPLDSSLRWNDSFTFGLYFRKNLIRLTEKVPLRVAGAVPLSR